MKAFRYIIFEVVLCLEYDILIIFIRIKVAINMPISATLFDTFRAKLLI